MVDNAGSYRPLWSFGRHIQSTAEIKEQFVGKRTHSYGVQRQNGGSPRHMYITLSTHALEGTQGRFRHAV